MTESGFYVDGRRFGAKADYEAALDDKILIDRIRSEYDFEDADSILKLSREMDEGNFNFKSPLGREFDDEIFELVSEIRSGEFEKKHPKEVVPEKKKFELKKKKTSKDNTPKKEKIIRDREVTNNHRPHGTEFDALVMQEIKAAERKRRIFLVVMALVCVACFGYYGVYYYFVGRTENTYDEWSAIREADENEVTITKDIKQATVSLTDPSAKPDILEKYKTLYNKNKSLIGWIKIADTNIDYPVMQTSNNEYYLDHNLNQEYDKNGSIFMDMNCDVLKPSTNLICYGHHMQSGKMFGGLGKYEDEKYFNDHQFIEFDTIYEEGVYQVMYVFRSHVFSEAEITFKYYQFIDANSEEEFNSNMEEMSNLSFYDTGVTAKYGDRLLTLSTCDYQEANGRFVVVAKKIQ